MKRYNEFLNEQSEDWDQKLINSAADCYLKNVKRAIDNGADVHAKNDLALRWACHEGNLYIVKYLVKKGANIHADDDEPLRWASSYGHSHIVKYLVEQGANIHANNDQVLRNASDDRSFGLVKYLCEYIIQNEPEYIPKILKYIPDELKEKYPHLFAASDMDLL